jgi:phospholipid-transporting ATPase
MSEVGEMIESNLELVGATAIEDMLQEKVPETIKTLREAGIKLWVLTGDKIETAINIAFSCNLITHDMVRIIIESRTGPEVKNELDKGLLTVKAENNSVFSLIISGEALSRATGKDLVKLLISLAEKCSVVICCRVSPQQKADVVKLVRDYKPKARTLSIGDGANDVNMITAAHVGIGIAGLEGQQAVRASDYSIGQFCFLQRLLFVHGRECYRRNANLICYNFYKNVLLVIPLFYYGMFSAYSGQLIYNMWTYQLFNIVFAAMPIVLYAIFDKEIPYFELETIPNYYKLGLQGELFSTSIFWFWILEAFCQGLVIVLLSLFALLVSTGDSEYGQMENVHVPASLIFALIVLFVNLKVINFSYSHYWFTILIIVVSTGSFFLFTALLTEILPINHWLDNFDSRGSSVRIMKNPNTYSAICISIFYGFFLKPIYDAAIEIKAMLKGNQVEPEPQEVAETIKEDIELLPDEILLAHENLKSYNRPHTGFAFSGEAGHTPQITDPGFFL